MELGCPAERIARRLVTECQPLPSVCERRKEWSHRKGRLPESWSLSALKRWITLLRLVSCSGLRLTIARAEKGTSLAEGLGKPPLQMADARLSLMLEAVILGTEPAATLGKVSLADSVRDWGAGYSALVPRRRRNNCARSHLFLQVEGRKTRHVV